MSEEGDAQDVIKEDSIFKENLENEEVPGKTEEKGNSGEIETEISKKASRGSVKELPDTETGDNTDATSALMSEHFSSFLEENLNEFEAVELEEESINFDARSTYSHVTQGSFDVLDKLEEHIEEVRSETGLSGISTPTFSGCYGDEEENHTNFARAATLTPFSHLWVFGCNANTGVVGCSLSEHSREIAYAASNLGILLNCDNKSIHRLPGHQNLITSIACDKKGKWLITVDSGLNSCLIIWYRKKRIPVFTKFAPEPAGFDQVAMSPCGRIFAVTCLGSSPYLLISEWSQPREFETIVILPDGFGIVEKLSFSTSSSSYVMVATSKTNVVFITYTSLDFLMEEADPFKDKIIDSTVGDFSDTTFLKVSSKAATATKYGFILLWSRSSAGKVELNSFLHLNPDPINVIRYHNGLVAAADQGGVVHFYDDKFRLRFSSHGFEMGPIVAFDFDHSKFHLDNLFEDNEEERSFSEQDVGDFLVATEDGRIILVDLVEKKLTDLIEPIPKKIICMHSCPTIDMMCIVTEDNQLRLYDLTMKELVYTSCLLCPRSDQTLPAVSILKFSTKGEYICCCQEDGTVRTLHSKTLSPIDQVAEGDKPIDMIDFSKNSDYLAAIDVELTLWMYLVSKSRSLTLIGKIRNIHADRVVSLSFTNDVPICFITVGADRRIIIHHLEKRRKSAVFEVIVKDKDHRIEQFAQPMCVISHPTKADHLILANSNYKYRILDMKNYVYTKTCMAPAIKNCKPINKMSYLAENDILFFVTGKMAGIQKLPLDGNPYKNISMHLCGTRIAHYGFAFNRFCLVTTGADDATVHMWKIKPEMVELVEVLGGIGLQPYYGLLEGGETGDVMKDIKDFFIYCQILHEGHAINYPREVGYTIRACELVNLFRALGYFPSEYEIRNLYNEIGIFARKDLYSTVIDFENVVKLFINHRPYLGMNRTTLLRAFRTLCARGGDSKTHILPRDQFISFLTEHGDCWRRGEFSTVVMHLAGHSCEERAPNTTAGTRRRNAVPGPPENLSVDDIAGSDDASRASSQTHHQMLQTIYNEILPPDVSFEFLYYDLLGMKRSRHRREHLMSGASKLSMSKIRKSKPSTMKKVSFVSGKIKPS